MRPDAGASSSAIAGRSPSAIASPRPTRKRGGRHGDVAHRHLPGADERVAADHAADAAVADRDEEALVGDRRQAQQRARAPRAGRATSPIEAVAAAHSAPRVPLHARRPAEQVLDRHVDDAFAGARIRDAGAGRRRRPRRSPRTDSARAAERDEGVEAARPRARARSAPAPRCTRSRAATCPARRSARCESSMRPPPGATTSGTAFERPAGADVVDHQDRVRVAHRPAGVDDLLRAALHLGVAALHGREVEFLAAGAAPLRGGRAAAEADQHRRPAEQHERRARGHGAASRRARGGRCRARPRS